MWIGPHHAAGSVGPCNHATGGAGIVDIVDNLKTHGPQYPQSIVLIAKGAGASAAFVDYVECPPLLVALYSILPIH